MDAGKPAKEEFLDAGTVAFRVKSIRAQLACRPRPGLLRDAIVWKMKCKPASPEAQSLLEAQLDVEKALRPTLGLLVHHYYAQAAEAYVVYFASGYIEVLLLKPVQGSDKVMALFDRLDALNLEISEFRLHLARVQRFRPTWRWITRRHPRDELPEKEVERVPRLSAAEASLASLQRRLYGVANRGVNLLERLAAGHKPGATEEEKQLLNGIEEANVAQVAELDDVGASFRRVRARIAKRHYVVAVLAGSLLFVPLLSSVLVTSNFPTLEWVRVSRELGLVLAMGGLGASLSVMARLMDNSKGLAREVDTMMLYLLGSLRPFVGAAFALALYVFVKGAILPLKMPTPNEAPYFLLGLGFLSGYGERWAQDMVFQASNRLGTQAAADEK